MNILVVGGTRFMGRHLVNELIVQGHKVTLATRGLTKEEFSEKVNRVIIDRTNEESIKNTFYNKEYDIVYDTIAYCSNDIKILLEHVKCKKYIVISTISVYEFEKKVVEEDFNPYTKELVWSDRLDYSYGENKRLMEAALFQNYSHLNPIAVRFPLVIGTDDYTNRFQFYVDNILSGTTIHVDNLEQPLPFVRSDEAGKFLAYLADSQFVGPINGGSPDAYSVKELSECVTKLTGKKLILSEEGEKAAYNSIPNFTMDSTKAKELGYEFTPLKDWVEDLVRYFVEKFESYM